MILLKSTLDKLTQEGYAIESTLPFPKFPYSKYFFKKYDFIKINKYIANLIGNK